MFNGNYREVGRVSSDRCRSDLGEVEDWRKCLFFLSIVKKCRIITFYVVS